MEQGSMELVPRQIWAITTTESNAIPHTCTPSLLPSGGVINIGGDVLITLTQEAAFRPICTGRHDIPPLIDPARANQSERDRTFGVREPYYQSTNPQIYAIAAATAVSYMLVIMLFITPRTFFVGGVGGGGGFLGHRGMIGGSYGNNPVIGVGSRPWLQKAATVAVAASLTIVTADTFKWAERQYDHGYEDAMELSGKVIEGREIRIVRVISETFLWLAQAQTLIRLFPRHKEKLVIKWTAFGLITLELLFSILNFWADEGGHAHPRRFNNAIPAMDYLFALTLNLCYAAFVFYYALCKRRFAFVHTNMRNMPLVALLSLVAVLIPVIFFILDLSKPEVSGWGSYVRWVGAAAASVVVWEWVERIEALERDEKKDGILGREIFDGDEMLETSQSSEYSWGSRKDNKAGGNDGGFGMSLSSGWHGLAVRTRALRRITRQTHSSGRKQESANPNGHTSDETSASQRYSGGDHSLTHPAPVASPISRADTASAASTVYRVRYHPVIEPTPPIQEALSEDRSEPDVEQQHAQHGSTSHTQGVIHPETSLTSRVFANGVSRILHPFKRPRDSPPVEVAQALSSNPQLTSLPHTNMHETSLLQRLHLKKSLKADMAPSGVIIVPAPQQRRPLSNAEDEPFQVDDEEPQEEGSDGPPISPTQRDSPPDAVLRAMHSPPLSQSSSRRSSQVFPGTAGNIRSSTRNTPMISESDEQEGHDVSPVSPVNQPQNRSQNTSPGDSSRSDQSQTINHTRTDHDR